MQLTAQDLAVLRKPFAVKDHEFLRGFTYITESAITTRIEDVDPEWTFEIMHVTTRDTQCIVHARMTIKGVVRDGIGMQVIQSAGEAEKGAATDALKRCARLFGIGRYLLDLPSGINDEKALAKHMGLPANVQQLPTDAAKEALGHPTSRVETTPETPAPNPLLPDWWNVAFPAIKKLPHFKGQGPHVANALNALLKDGTLKRDMTHEQVIEVVTKLYADDDKLIAS